MKLTIAADPLALDDESVLERVLMIAGAPAAVRPSHHDPARRRAQSR